MERCACLSVLMTILCCNAWKIVPAIESKIEERLDAIENLVRGEMYFVRKDIQTDREEREQFMQKLNETLDTFTNYVGANKATGTHRQAENRVDTNNMDKLTEKVGQNSVAIEEISDALLRNRRGIMAEKQARKLEVIQLMTEMIKLQQNQDIVMKNQDNMLQRLSDIMQNQNQTMKENKELVTQIQYIKSQSIDLQNATEELSRKTESLEKKVDAQQDELKLCTGNLMTSTTRSTTAVKTEATTANIMTITPTMIPDGTVRLVGGRDEYEGRVEVSYGGIYGTVCDDHWDDPDAMVVCRMLGFTGGIGYHGRGSPSHPGPQHDFGPGAGEILLDDAKCRGDEESLFSCQHLGIGVHDCNHNEDAGVRCDP